MAYTTISKATSANILKLHPYDYIQPKQFDIIVIQYRTNLFAIKMELDIKTGSSSSLQESSTKELMMIYLTAVM